MWKGVLDLEKHFALYGAYHRNPVNILIHTISVWLIFFNSLVLFHFIPPLLHIPFVCGFDLNFAFTSVILYALLFVVLDKKAGSLGAVLCLLCWFGSQALTSCLGFSLAWKVVLTSQLICFTGQFIGHRVFEKRSPSLLDNLSLAFLMAPFFVLLEVLGNHFHYEPYPGFFASVCSKIEADRRGWQACKQKKSS
ncbi:hypothetical protein HPP92_002364 [Vanilla planifolia]|uniref:Uncharacterized protein n=1 Tax=Vanilla planifolia TaxID=51239 RepID=A0A835S5D1_VANPL|nr:hypothetical protein HPP92_002364 [Vanilla planifolia]